MVVTAVLEFCVVLPTESAMIAEAARTYSYGGEQSATWLI